MLRPRTTSLVLFGLALGVAGTAFAGGAADVRKRRKAPSSKEAIALPMAEHPPGYCDPEHAGWMYLDIEMRDAGSLACVCVQDKDLTWTWATFGSVKAECD